MSTVRGTLAERRRIIARLRRLKAEIEQMFTDAASWNDNARKEGKEPIDPDPFGEMRRLLTAIDELLAKDTGSGPIPPLNFERSH